MKKIIAVFDGLKYSESTQQYALSIARQKDVHLVGVFLEDFSYHSYKIYDLLSEEGGGLDTKRRKLDKKDEKRRAAAIAGFEKACTRAGVSFNVHKDRGIAIHELLKESIYADLLIIDRKETLTHHTEKIPTRFIRDLLGDVQCPVLLVPSKYVEIEKAVLLFDGEPSSVYAIKMLSYTLPELQATPVQIITVHEMDSGLSGPDKLLMKEFATRHFPHAGFTTLKGLAEIQITNFLKKEKKQALVTLGAYRRGKVSRWFRSSMADTLMKDLDLPLFIAHNK